MKRPTAGSGRSLSDFFTKTGATLVIILEMLCIDLRSDREAGVPMCENDKNISAMFGDGFMFFSSYLLSFGSSRISVFRVVSKVQESIETMSFT